MSNFSPWLVLIIGFAIGWFVQWFVELFYFRRRRTHILRRLEEMDGILAARNAELGAERNRNATLQADNAALRASLAAQQAFGPPAGADIEAVESVEKTPATAAVVVAAPTATKAEDQATGPVDELAAIVGLTAAHKAKLGAVGIFTWEALANATAEQLDLICQAPDHSRPDYASWILQAQEQLADRGAWAFDDLTAIHGIDATNAAILNEEGFTNFRRLAAVDASSLALAVAAPPWRDVRYADWIAQAKLAAAGDWAGMEALVQQRAGADNLLLIDGIDAATAAALASHGIDSFASLATVAPALAAQIGQEAGLAAGEFERWRAEATMRATGKRVRRARRKQAPAGSSAWTGCPQYLAQVKGIGPLYERRLYLAGIGAFWELANLDDDALVRILAPHPWQEVDFASIRADAAQLAEDANAVGCVWDGSRPDDLCLIDGVSRMYEARLHEAGVCTFEALAEATPAQLADICKAPDWKTPNYESWIATAKSKLEGATA